MADHTSHSRVRKYDNQSLMRPLTSIIGREKELVQIKERLQRPDTRLLTLTGTGGVGKTRLASEVFEDFRNDPMNVDVDTASISLAALEDPKQVLPTIAQSLGLQQTDQDQPITDYLRRELHDRRLFIFLDNFERLLPAAPSIADLLRACPKITIFTTSRAPLDVRGEQEFALRPLEVPRQRAFPNS